LHNEKIQKAVIKRNAAVKKSAYIMTQITFQVAYFSIFAFMFRKISATLLLLAFVAQTFSAPFIRLDYYFNQADYAKNCVNKARPKMHCKGKCQMMKKIAAEEKKEQQQEERKAGSKTEVLSSKSFFTTLSPVFTAALSGYYFLGNDNKEIKMPRTFFHPPTV
jgi:hypothetical protein